MVSVFHKIDTDKSGTITFDEFSGLFGPQMSRGVLLELFKAIDSDSSGSIDFKEFKHFVDSL